MKWFLLSIFKEEYKVATSGPVNRQSKIISFHTRVVGDPSRPYKAILVKPFSIQLQLLYGHI